MSEIGGLSGLLYDWHNGLRLDAQTKDVRFWERVLEESSLVVVLGAGTGRIAMPLARLGMHVLAVDSDVDRLDRIDSDSGVATLCADLADLPFRALPHSDVVIPYSTLQLVDLEVAGRALSNLRSLIRPTCRVWIDISTSFIGRAESDWFVALDEWCEDLHARVIERQRIRNQGGVCEIEIEFRLQSGVLLLETTERWFHHPPTDIVQVANDSGFEVVREFLGYGSGQSPHRRIFELCAMPPEPQYSA